MPTSSLRPIPVGRLVAVTGKGCPPAPAAEPDAPVARPAPRRRAVPPWLVVILGAYVAGLMGVVAAAASFIPAEVAEPAPVLIAEDDPPPPVSEPAPVVPVEPSQVPPVPRPNLPESVAEFDAHPRVVARGTEEPSPAVKLPDLPPELPARPRPKTACEKFGTTVAFEADPADAFRRAADEKKLVFLIHLSGNFEAKEFT